jgi:predicted NUDIX family phosphoesterase
VIACAPEMEFVYVVKRYDLFELSFPHGFVACSEAPADVARWVERIRERGFFVERRAAERDSSMKQIIPYCLVTTGDDLFVLHRFGTQGEKRLHDKLSIGVGGHINPVDTGDADVLDAGTQRELLEELRFETGWRREVIGIINDESTSVGSVHFGIVHRVRADSREVAVRETDQMGGGFQALPELRSTFERERHRFETWSSLILDRIDDALAAPAGDIAARR